jgi:protein SCO1/2
MEDRLTTARLAARHWATLVALGLILVITLAWWGLALWPLPDTAPPALVRARIICFGSTATGLPSGVGWMMLIGEPIMITLLLVSVTGSSTIREALAGIARSSVGRIGLGAITTGALLAFLAAGVRVAWALGGGSGAPRPDPASAANAPRLDRPAPALDLVDQRGNVVTLAALRGRPALVTFAYAHCETVCPLVVQEVVQARRDLEEQRPAVVVITLDPWRDTPSRLPSIARKWGLPDDAFVLSGPIIEVEAVLNRWGIPRARDVRNGDVTHPQVVYVLDREGRLAFVTTGAAEVITGLVQRL